MRPRRLWLGLLLAGLLAGCREPLTAGDPPPPADDRPSLGLVPPAGWTQVAEPSAGTVIELMPSSGGAARVTVTAARVPGLPDPPNLSLLQASLADAWPAGWGEAGYRLVTSREETVGDHPTIRVDATLGGPAALLRVRQYRFFQRDWQVVLTGQAPAAEFESVAPQFEQLAAALRIGPGEGED